MKRLFAGLIAMLMCCAVMCCSAEETSDTWYKITSGTVLTVWLPGNTADGMDWDFEISSPPHFELLTHEVLEGETGEDGSAPTTYAASFRGFSGEEANVSIIFTYAAEGDEVPRSTRVLEMELDAESNITLLSVTRREASAEWVEYTGDMAILTVRLPSDGDEWTVTQLEENALELITCEEVDGTFVASYFASGEYAGDTEIYFACGDGRIYTVRMDISETGEINIKYAEEFTIIK